MAKKKLSRKKLNQIIGTIITIIVIVLSAYEAYQEYKAKEASANVVEAQYTTGTSETIDLNNDKLNMVFFYVGQADCSLNKFRNQTMLIDAGNNENGKNIANY